MENYPTDELGADIKSNLTFTDVFTALNNYKDIYKVLGVADSFVRERVFNQLTKLFSIDYDSIYEQWLKSV